MTHELDDAARVNLTENQMLEYIAYRDRLVAEGMSNEDIYEILCGFIWDASEETEMAEYVEPEASHEVLRAR
jgi:hypothetical protein